MQMQQSNHSIENEQDKPCHMRQPTPQKPLPGAQRCKDRPGSSGSMGPWAATPGMENVKEKATEKQNVAKEKATEKHIVAADGGAFVTPKCLINHFVIDQTVCIDDFATTESDE
eukprot:11177546-Lingulodinium_polyedra.AAC.1